MKDNNSYIGFACFFLLIVTLIAVGSFLVYRTYQKPANNSVDTTNNSELKEKIKKDANKDFIYFTNEEKISEDLNISYKKAIINLKSADADKVNEELDQIYSNALTTVKKQGQGDTTCANNIDLYSAKTIDYATYTYHKYLTLLVTINSYSCQDEVETPEKIISYTFDGTSGKQVPTEELLEQFHTTYTEVLAKIKTNIDNGNAEIEVDETLNQLKENETYTIYISEMDKLVVKYIVKTNTHDYNDIIELS